MNDPNRIKACDIDWRDMPTLRKVGRYLFFAFCAFGASIPIYAVALAVGVDKPPSQMLGNVGAMIVFIALRDMSKQWDWVLHKQAELRAIRCDGGLK